MTTTQTKPRGIVCKEPQVHALLNGATQIRVPIKPQPTISPVVYEWKGQMRDFGIKGQEFAHDCAPFQPGDTLYVKETWAGLEFEYDWETGIPDGWHQANPEDVIKYFQFLRLGASLASGMFGQRFGFVYRAGFCGGEEVSKEERGFTWRSPIHMPYEAARIVRRVTGVRVERVQEVSEEDAIKCGYTEASFFENFESIVGYPYRQWKRMQEEFVGEYVSESEADPIDWANWLYQSLYGNESWERNDWVWVFDLTTDTTPLSDIDTLEG